MLFWAVSKKKYFYFCEILATRWIEMSVRCVTLARADASSACRRSGARSSAVGTASIAIRHVPQLLTASTVLIDVAGGGGVVDDEQQQPWSRPH